MMENEHEKTVRVLNALDDLACDAAIDAYREYYRIGGDETVDVDDAVHWAECLMHAMNS